MKKIITSALILALSIGTAQAQTAEKAHKKGNKENKMRGGSYEKLNLSAEQKTQLQAIRERHKTELQALKSNSSLTADQQKAQRAELHKKYKSQAEAVLTPEQKLQAQKMIEERKATGNFRKNGSQGKARAGNFHQDLNLTQDQQQKMQQLRSDFKAKHEGIRNNQALSQEQKKAEMESLKNAQKEQMKSILTQEQIQKMESRKKKGAQKQNRNTK
ncbi:MAG: hypothetical protein H0U44_01715 [Flavisolibacter sp.]|jgi:Spy/CpxP family protein refolding chaperone|nr:hypothetical protein [Flavisolibacter sp.]